MRHPGVLLASLLAAAPAAMSADIANQPTLTLEGAKRIAAAAVAYARAHDAPGAAVAIVDAGGHAMYLERLDGTFVAGSDISIGKARTAVAFKRATRGIEETINKGRTAMVPVAGVTWFTPLQGGIPITVAKQIVGGIGVRGASSAEQDEEVAIAGAEALQGDRPATAAPQSDAPKAQVTYVAAEAVARAFGQGDTGSTLIAAEGFRVNASRRDGPGDAE